MATAAQPVTQPVTQLAPAQPLAAATGDSCCKKAIQVIESIALQILVPLALALGLYFTLPFSISVIVIPVAVTAALVAMNYFFAKAAPVAAEPTLPMTETAPAGLRNAGNDCWLNSLLQVIKNDQVMKQWFTEVPNALVAHCSYFDYLSQALLENLPAQLPPAAYGNLAANDPRRGRIDNYAQNIRNKTQAEKDKLFPYLRFLRQFPTAMNPQATPQVVAATLVEFKKFMTSYEKGQRERPGQALRLPAPPVAPAAAPTAPATQQGKAAVAAAEPQNYNSHDLRMAIANIWPQINMQDGHMAANSQQDPDEAFPGIEFLLPEHLKIQIQERQHYDLPYNQTTGQLQPISDVANNARLVDGRVIVKDADPTSAYLKCAISGSYPNAQNFIERYFDDPNSDSGNRIKRTIDGIEYEFPLVRTERQFLTAPESLWIQAKRFERTTSQWVGLHRIAPDLFPAQPSTSLKLNDSIEFQQIVEVQPVNGPLVRLALDSFIHHSGVCGGGHYTSYERRVDAQGNATYFKMDDSRITRISETKWRSALEEAYIVHYSKMEE